MRIAILHYSKPPTIGGVERVLGEQASALVSLGHEVEVFTRHEWKATQWDVVIVHNVFTMPFDLAWTQELIKLTETRPDIRWVNWVHDVRWAEKVPQAVHVAGLPSFYGDVESVQLTQPSYRQPGRHHSGLTGKPFSTPRRHSQLRCQSGSRRAIVQ